MASAPETTASDLEAAPDGGPLKSFHRETPLRTAGGGIDTKLRMLQAEGARMSREPGLFDGDPAAYR